MKSPFSEQVKLIFGNLQKVESFLERTVRGYQAKAKGFDSFEQYFEANNKHIGEAEKTRINESIQVYKGVKTFQNEHGELPKVDLSSVVLWKDQLANQKEQLDRNIRFRLVKDDHESGLVFVENLTTGVQAVSEFNFRRNSDSGVGHIQLKSEGGNMLPMLEAVLRHQSIVDSASANSKLPTYDQIDSAWLLSRITALKSSGKVFEEAVMATGTRNPELDNEEMSLGM